MTTPSRKERAEGLILGHLVGDALGTTYEFQHAPVALPERLDVVGGGPFRVAPGQITDDGEMMLTLARTLVSHGEASAHMAYAAWAASCPPDIGATTSRACRTGLVNAAAHRAKVYELNGGPTQQANGALMRVAPIALSHYRKEYVRAAEFDAGFTHPSEMCVRVNGLYANLLGMVLREQKIPWAELALDAGFDLFPQALVCDGAGQGHVLLAFRVACAALRAVQAGQTYAEAMRDILARGGDTDTNAAIAGALIGAHVGLLGIPTEWVLKVLNARVSRPAQYRPTDALKLATALARKGGYL